MIFVPMEYLANKYEDYISSPALGPGILPERYLNDANTQPVTSRPMTVTTTNCLSLPPGALPQT